jgi:hypothetical protein
MILPNLKARSQEKYKVAGVLNSKGRFGDFIGLSEGLEVK